MKSFFRSFPYSTFLISILCMGLGLSLLLWPDHAMTVMCYGFGGVLILAGILQTVIYIAGEKKGLVQKLMLLSVKVLFLVMELLCIFSNKHSVGKC